MASSARSVPGGLQAVLRGSKDAAIGFALRAFLNARLGAIGEITAFSFDSAGRRARVRIRLRGEADPIDLHIRSYALDQVDGRDWLTIGEVDGSREWLVASLRHFAVGRRIPLAPSAARALRFLT